MRFDLLSLKLFVTVCEQQSISRTADLEHIAASAVSKRISDLEQTMKSPLFYRGQKGLEITPAGHDLLKHARIVMRDLMQLESDMLDHAKGERGEVRICAAHSPIVQHFPADLAKFLSSHPAIRVTIDERLSQEAIQAVCDNAADIGIVGGHLPTFGLHVTHYRTDRLVVIAPRGHALCGAEHLNFAQLVEHDLVGPQEGSCLDTLLLRAATELARPLRLRIRVNGFEAASSMVEANLGIALVPEYHAARYAAQAGIVPIPLEEPWAVRHWTICSREPRSLPAPVKLLLDHLSAWGRGRDAAAAAMAIPRVVPIAAFRAAAARK